MGTGPSGSARRALRNPNRIPSLGETDVQVEDSHRTLCPPRNQSRDESGIRPGDFGGKR
jgi:hypothetical protein